METDKRHLDTIFLRASAILLVINSHLDFYYPIPFIGTGGTIGNSLFFFLSSFGLTKSAQNKRIKFIDYLAKRINRIYPAVWFTIFFLLFPSMIYQNRFQINKISLYIGYFFYPPFWFLRALMIYYIISYFYIYSRDKAIIIKPILLSVLSYFFVYTFWLDLSSPSVEKAPFKLIFYFLIFLFGIHIAKSKKDIVYNGPIDLVFLFLSVSTIYLHRFLMTKNILPEMQFIQHAAMFPTVLFALKACRSPFVLNGIMKNRVLASISNFLASRTLEIYIVHMTISPHIRNLKLPFPFNIFLFLTLTLLISVFCHYLTDIVNSKFDHLQRTIDVR
jgi:peptidoglycan/LPS O-acetylase OafA/YrhL